MRRLGYANVHIVEGDGTCGWPAEAPFDAIVAAASGSHVPTVLVDQLRPGGRIVMPIGGKHSVQSLVQLTKREDGGLDRRDLGAVRFVPLIGEHAFPERG
jgi:protein-L-isoaspartate(D-aspartate) O-methyltransferase